jgi:lipopolysaccharide biosynthesis protein
MIFRKKVAVLYHIFYEDTIYLVIEELERLSDFQVFFLFNISSDAPNQLEIKGTLLKHFPDSIITISGNKGKDVGGKLLLISTYIQLGIEVDWIIFLHDKKSLQALNAKTWKTGLLKIIDPAQLERINTIISSDSGFGIIAANNYVMKELREQGEFIGNNGPILTRLLKEYKISCNNFEYVAGTMFWAKASILMDFFKKHDPLRIRQTLEEGNVIDNFGGTYTHSWERILSWIIISRGLNIKKI